VGIDRRRQAETKRRLRRARLGRRYGRFLVWGATGAVGLLVGLIALNHFVLTRDTVELTIGETRQTRVDREVRYSVEDADGTTYDVRGLRAARTFHSLREGERYRCRVRGMAVEVPLFWDLHREITNCDPAR
jgi:hypothetical protein